MEQSDAGDDDMAQAVRATPELGPNLLSQRVVINLKGKIHEERVIDLS